MLIKFKFIPVHCMAGSFSVYIKKYFDSFYIKQSNENLLQWTIFLKIFYFFGNDFFLYLKIYIKAKCLVKMGVAGRYDQWGN